MASKHANVASKSDIPDLVKKTDFDNELGFNQRINSNKTKHAVAEDELNELKKMLKQYQQKD